MKKSSHIVPLTLICLFTICSCGSKKDAAEKITDTEISQTPLKTPGSKPEPKPVSRSLFLFGIDGATWDLMDPLLEAGKLPNLKKLIENGLRAPLKTFEPTASPLIWTSLATGVEPDKHGITDFVVKIPGTEETLLPTSNMRRVNALWNILPEYGTSTGVVGWWATYPAEPIDGFIISDQANTLRNTNYETALQTTVSSPAGQVKNNAVHPPELADALQKPLSLSPVVPVGELSRFVELGPAEIAKIANQSQVDVEDIFSIFKFAWLIDRSFIESTVVSYKAHSPQVLMLYLNGLDAAEHHFWKYLEPTKFKDVNPSDAAKYGDLINRYYEYMDEELGKLLALFKGKELTVVVASDHGHEANIDYNPKSDDHFNRICSGGHHHAPDGIVVISGADIQQGATLLAPNVYDITPTILALMGVPIGSDMKGRALTEAFSSSFKSAHPIRTVPTHSADRKWSLTPIRSEMSDALKKKLEGLGYIQN